MSDIFGMSAKALQLTEDRAQILTNNLVNSATPQYKARDFDFHKVLQQTNDSVVGVETTNPLHISGDSLPQQQNLQYRVPMQTSMDGNTVDEEMARKDFLENAIQYQVNLTFVQNETSEMMQAIKGD